MIYSDSVSILDTTKDDDGVNRILQYVLRGVYLERSSGVTISKDGENQAYGCTLFVPKTFSCDEEYVEPAAWEQLSYDEKLSHFSFRPRQLIVGAVTQLSYSTLDEIINSEPVCYQVIGVDYLTKVLPHFEVLGK